MNSCRRFQVHISRVSCQGIKAESIGVTESIFRIGSTSPASVLVDAIDQLEQSSPKADDNIQLIRPQLAEAVDACVKAAGQEFNVHWQKQLLKVIISTKPK